MLFGFGSEQAKLEEEGDEGCQHSLKDFTVKGYRKSPGSWGRKFRQSAGEMRGQNFAWQHLSFS